MPDGLETCRFNFLQLIYCVDIALLLYEMSQKALQMLFGTLSGCIWIGIYVKKCTREIFYSAAKCQF